MKKISILALSLVLTAALFAGCRNRNQPLETSRPTVAPTTQATTVPTTEATHPNTQSTETPVNPSETVDHGNGPIESSGTTEATSATGTTEGTAEGRSAVPTPRGR